jgi:hypothetical protein
MESRISTPHEFALANGWDAVCVEATAERGVSPEDVDRLEETGVTEGELVSWCREMVAADGSSEALAEVAS